MCISLMSPRKAHHAKNNILVFQSITKIKLGYVYFRKKKLNVMPCIFAEVSSSRCNSLNLKVGLPCCLVVKNPPANTGDTGSISDPGRPHVPQSKWAQAPSPDKARPQEACRPQLEGPPAPATPEPAQQRDLVQTEMNTKTLKKKDNP